jgi:hypothetical protein
MGETYIAGREVIKIIAKFALKKATQLSKSQRHF